MSCLNLPWHLLICPRFGWLSWNFRAANRRWVTFASAILESRELRNNRVPGSWISRQLKENWIWCHGLHRYLICRLLNTANYYPSLSSVQGFIPRKQNTCGRSLYSQATSAIVFGHKAFPSWGGLRTHISNYNAERLCSYVSYRLEIASNMGNACRRNSVRSEVCTSLNFGGRRIPRSMPNLFESKMLSHAEALCIEIGSLLRGQSEWSSSCWASQMVRRWTTVHCRCISVLSKNDWYFEKRLTRIPIHLLINIIWRLARCSLDVGSTTNFGPKDPKSNLTFLGTDSILRSWRRITRHTYTNLRVTAMQ